jgi:hypothetical protein
MLTRGTIKMLFHSNPYNNCILSYIHGIQRILLINETALLVLLILVFSFKMVVKEVNHYIDV